jgi:hypothetical protein
LLIPSSLTWMLVSGADASMGNSSQKRRVWWGALARHPVSAAETPFGCCAGMGASQSLSYTGDECAWRAETGASRSSSRMSSSAGGYDEDDETDDRVRMLEGVLYTVEAWGMTSFNALSAAHLERVFQKGLSSCIVGRIMPAFLPLPPEAPVVGSVCSRLSPLTLLSMLPQPPEAGTSPVGGGAGGREDNGSLWPSPQVLCHDGREWWSSPCRVLGCLRRFPVALVASPPPPHACTPAVIVKAWALTGWVWAMS